MSGIAQGGEHLLRRVGHDLDQGIEHAAHILALGITVRGAGILEDGEILPGDAGDDLLLRRVDQGPDDG